MSLGESFASSRLGISCLFKLIHVSEVVSLLQAMRF